MARAYRRPKLHRIEFVLIDKREDTHEVYWTDNGLFTIVLPPYQIVNPDDQIVAEYDPMREVQCRYVGYRYDKVRFRDRVWDAWDVLRGRSLAPAEDEGTYWLNRIEVPWNPNWQ